MLQAKSQAFNGRFLQDPKKKGEISAWQTGCAELTRSSYNSEDIEQLFKLDDIPGEANVSKHLQGVFKDMMLDVLQGTKTPAELAEKQKQFPLKFMADKWTAKAVQRTAQAYGLPGEVLHSLYQGKVRFFGAGTHDQVKVAVVQESDSTWDMSAHKCGCWLLGYSGVGKDNALAALRAITDYAMEATEADHGCLQHYRGSE